MSSFIVADWMMGKRLCLKGCELLIFAMIVSYSRKGKTLFVSEQSLAEYTGYTKRHISNALKNLRARGLIVQSRGKHSKYLTNEYTVDDEVKRKYFNVDVEYISPIAVKKLQQESGNNFTNKGEITSTNNNTKEYKNKAKNKDDACSGQKKKRHVRRNAALDIGLPEDFSGPNRI